MVVVAMLGRRLVPAGEIGLLMMYCGYNGTGLDFDFIVI